MSFSLGCRELVIPKVFFCIILNKEKMILRKYYPTIVLSDIHLGSEIPAGITHHPFYKGGIPGFEYQDIGIGQHLLSFSIVGNDKGLSGHIHPLLGK